MNSKQSVGQVSRRFGYKSRSGSFPDIQMSMQMHLMCFSILLRRLNIDSDGMIDGCSPGNSIIGFMDASGELIFDAFTTAKIHTRASPCPSVSI
jgi:hypothetical protein